ncbi:MAG: hypothetical protein PHQ48_00535 [Acidobacteriota bacterium]|nr:hypothetical protein [Acidobacteriota bacterium]
MSQSQSQTERQEYYQKIARAFLEHQSSLFFLPPRDVALIAEWEKLHIPLEAILEGIDRTFSRQLLRKRKKRIYSLSQCEKEILRAYSEYQERLVGKKAALVEQTEKISRAKQEVEACLKNLPQAISYLREPLEEALACLEAEKPDEAVLEALDEKLEEMIWDETSENEKTAALEEVRKEYPGKSDYQLSEIQQIWLVKKIRQIYRIPHLSIFYY